MELILVCGLLAAVSAGRLENTYLPPQSSGSSSGSNLLSAPVRGSQRLSGLSSGKIIPIVRLDSDNNGDGNYKFSYETANRITAEESGQLQSGSDWSAVKGSFSYVGDDGQTYAVNYVADENGYRAEGAHIPTPPPVPSEILKALAENAAEEARGIFDDGQYRPQPGEDDGQYTKTTGQQGGYRY